MSCPDPYRPYDPSETPAPAHPDVKVEGPKAETTLPTDADVHGLARTLAASGGADFAKDLALDLVLNQIVEQACLATGATGAAIALTRDGEMVCRATTGRNAPDLGVRLDNAGFSSECLRIGTLQRCDDTETDPRVDPAACRLLGVRSILVVPLWYWGEFMGIFEIFSPRPNAFGERDEQTLQALAYRIVRHAKQATGTITGFTANPEKVAVMIPKAPDTKPQPEVRREAPAPPPVVEFNPSKRTPNEPRDFWTIGLASVAMLIAAAIVSLMIWRVGWASSSSRQPIVPPKVVQASSPASAAAPVNPPPVPHEEMLTLDTSALDANSAAPSAPPLETKPAKKKEANAVSAKNSPTLGGLAIYDKDKLVYGTPIPDADDSGPAKPPVAKPPKPRAVPARATSALSALEASRAVQLKPEVADDLLTTRVEPEYPDAARRAHVQGMVTLDTLIGADGSVQQVNPVSGNPQLAEAAAVAVRQWRYKPYLLKGKPVPVHTQVNVQFMLAQ